MKSLLILLLFPIVAHAQLDMRELAERSQVARRNAISTWTRYQTLYKSGDSTWDSIGTLTCRASFDTSGRLTCDSCSGDYTYTDCYSYDGGGRLVMRIQHTYTNAKRSEMRMLFGDPPPRRLRSAYWDVDRPRSLGDSSALLTSRDLLEYDAHDSLVRWTELLHGVLDTRTTYTYSREGHRPTRMVARHTDWRATTTWRYDRSGRLVESLTREGGDQPERSTFLYRDSSSRPYMEIEERFRRDTNRIFYDSLGREMMRYTTTYMNNDYWSRWHIYDALGRPVEAVSYIADSVANPLDREEWKSYTMSRFGRTNSYDGDGPPVRSEEWEDGSLTITRHEYTYHPR